MSRIMTILNYVCTGYLTMKIKTDLRCFAPFYNVI